MRPVNLLWIVIGLSTTIAIGALLWGVFAAISYHP